MSNELRTDFTADERNTIIQNLRDEFGDREFSDEMAGVQREDITKRLLEKRYVKVQWSQWNDGELTKSDVKLYQPGSNDLMAAIAEAIENWKNMWAEDFMLQSMDLNATSGKLMDLRTKHGNEYEIWEIL